MSKATYDVILVGIDEWSKARAIKAIVHREGITPPEAFAIMQTLPYTIKSNISKEEAEEIRQYYEENNVQIDIVSNYVVESVTAAESISNEILNEGSSKNQETNNLQVGNLYNIAEKNIEAGMFDKAIEYCDKIHEMDVNDFNAWNFKTKIVGLLYLKEYRDTSMLFSRNEYSLLRKNSSLEARIANEESVEDKKSRLAETNNRYFNFAHMAFSNADEKQKIELLIMMTEIAKEHIYLLLINSGELYERKNFLLTQAHKGYFDFIKNHYDEKVGAEYIDKYISTLLKGIKETKNRDSFVSNIKILNHTLSNIKDNSYTKTKEEVIEQISLIEKIISNQKVIDELKELVKSMNSEKELVLEGKGELWAKIFNENQTKLQSIYNSDVDAPDEFKQEIEELLATDINTYIKKKGCYVATCVYGSYDCPEVWVLRRFRDYTLDETIYGRAFIKMYYAISPKMVKVFGDSKLFKKIWKKVLDKMIAKLKISGYQDTKYVDKY